MLGHRHRMVFKQVNQSLDTRLVSTTFKCETSGCGEEVMQDFWNGQPVYNGEDELRKQHYRDSKKDLYEAAITELEELRADYLRKFRQQRLDLIDTGSGWFDRFLTLSEVMQIVTTEIDAAINKLGGDV